jgi:hypothetical protein
MAQWHLDQLMEELERKGWQFVRFIPSEDLYVSGSWEIRRFGSLKSIFIDFNGVDDLNTLSMEESYGCRIREKTDGLYFSKQGIDKKSENYKIWKKNLKDFVENIKKGEEL